MSRTKFGIGSAITVAATIAAATWFVPSFEVRRPVDTAAMLDVSVTIRTVSHVTIDQVGDSVWNAGSGSGFRVSAANCELWTAQHVVQDAAIVEVFPRGWTGTQGISATVMSATPQPDVAVLRMDHCDGIAVARLGDSARMKAGDETYAVGNPLGLNPDSISRGIISHTKRYLNGTTAFLQTDAAINPGNSGGALFNRAGEVIGINTAIASTTGNNAGIGYAVPINHVQEVVAALRQGPPDWGDAGIQEVAGTLTRDEASLFNLPDAQGAVILTATPSAGPAAGKLQARDIIYRIANRPVRDAGEALRVISSHASGATLDFDILRDGRAKSMSITLANGWTAQDEKIADPYDGVLGMTIEMWADEERGKRFETPVITMVHSLGPAHRAQISSSQRNMAMRGPMVVPYQMDVKTITGLVYGGSYHAISDIDTLNDFAAQAVAEASPLLLEIQLWGRRNQNAIHESLEHLTTAFFKVQPEASIFSAQDNLEANGTTPSDPAPAAPAAKATPAREVINLAEAQ